MKQKLGLKIRTWWSKHESENKEHLVGDLHKFENVAWWLLVNDHKMKDLGRGCSWYGVSRICKNKEARVLKEWNGYKSMDLSQELGSILF